MERRVEYQILKVEDFLCVTTGEEQLIENTRNVGGLKQPIQRLNSKTIPLPIKQRLKGHMPDSEMENTVIA